MTIQQLIDKLKDKNISLDIEIKVRIDTLRTTKNNSIQIAECHTIYTELNSDDTRSLILCGDIFEK